MASNSLADPADGRSLSYRFRQRRDVGLRDFLLAAPRRGETLSVIDIGGGLTYWQRVGIDWLTEHRIEVLCVNRAEGDLYATQESHGPVTLRVADGTALSDLRDGEFDVAHSNSVIEHVGRWREMEAFAHEVRRLAPAYYVQTPYFWFPLDPHFHRMPFIHWMPAPMRLALLRRFKIGYSKPTKDVARAMGLVESNVMLGRTQFAALFPDATLSWERIAGLPKSMIATRRQATGQERDR